MENNQAVESSAEPLVFDVREFERASAEPATAAVSGTAATTTETAAGTASAEPAAATEQQPASPAESTEKPGEKAGEEPTSKRDPRINEYYKQQGELKELRERLAKLETGSQAGTQQQQQPQTATPKPVVSSDPKDPRPAWDPERYAEGGYEEFIADTSRWATREERRAEKAREAEEQQKTRAAQQIADWQSKVAAAAIPGYEQTVANAARKFTNPDPALLSAVVESSVGPQLVHYFAANPAEVERFDKLSLPSQLRELGKLEMQLEKAGANGAAARTPNTTTPGVSKAPPPVQPVRGGSGPVSAKREEIDDFDAAMKADGIEINRGRFANRRR